MESRWECRNCNLTNAHTNSECGECSAEKPEAVHPDLSSNEQSASFPCKTNEDNEQEKLGTQTPHTPSEWECRNCNLTNAHTNSKCTKCSTENPEAAQPDLSSNEQSASFPCETNEDNEQAKLGTQTPHTPSGWECRNCNLTNAHANSKCTKCSTENPEAAHPDLSSNEQSASFPCETNEDNEQEKLGTQTPHIHSEWKCKECNLTNAHTNSKCTKCSTEKPEAVHTDLSSNEQSAMDIAYLNNERRIVLLGRTGSGKSATGNAILGNKCFKSQISFSSVTSQCKLGSSLRFGKKIIAVDTPGLFDTSVSNDHILKEIIKCVGITSPGPHALLFVITVGRFTPEEEGTISKLIELFGEGVLNYVIVLFTCIDNLEHEDKTIKEYVETAPGPLRLVLQKCENRFIGFNNRASPDENDTQVKGLLSEIDKIVRNNGGKFYTNAMYEEAERAVQRRMREIHDKHNREKEEAERKYKELMREQEICLQLAQQEKSKHEEMELEKRQKELELEAERLARKREKENHEEDLERQRQQARAEIEKGEPGAIRLIVSGVSNVGKGIWTGIKNCWPFSR